MNIVCEIWAALLWLRFRKLLPLAASFSALVLNAGFFGPSLNPECLCEDAERQPRMLTLKCWVSKILASIRFQHDKYSDQCTIQQLAPVTAFQQRPNFLGVGRDDTEGIRTPAGRAQWIPSP
jgi:hypothetical protein